MRVICQIFLFTLAGISAMIEYADARIQTAEQFAEDFDFLWQQLGNSYAYFDQRQTDWNRVQATHRPLLKKVENRESFVGLLEDMLGELYDHHCHLNTNTSASPKLVPSASDIWAEIKDGQAIVTQVRAESCAQRAGIKAGMKILSIDGAEVQAAVDAQVGKCLIAPDPEAQNWALRVLLAGRHNRSRKLLIDSDLGAREFEIDAQTSLPIDASAARELLTKKRMGDDLSIVYIRFHNSLGSIKLIPEYDRILDEMEFATGLILDLRDTPSGGNTTVARGIMGRLINHEGFYQKHSIPMEAQPYDTNRAWMEIVSPRGKFQFSGPVVVLVDHWTGSMGEGITIGLHGLNRGTIVGTRMAGLLGATTTVTLPNTQIGVSFAVEKLFHVDGSPRENFVPQVTVDLLRPENQDLPDPILEAGISTLRELIRSRPSQ